MEARRQVLEQYRLTEAGGAGGHRPRGDEDAPAVLGLAAEVEAPAVGGQPRVQLVFLGIDRADRRRGSEGGPRPLLDRDVDVEVVDLLVLLGGEEQVLWVAIVEGEERAAVVHPGLDV